MDRLDGKVAIITGAANGIGRAVTQRFVAEGARLLLVDRDAVGLESLAEAFDGEVEIMTADVSEDGSAEQYTKVARQRFGRIDIGVLNAGIESEVGLFGQASTASFDRVMAVNVRGVFLGLSALMPAMKQTGGSIIVTSSIGGVKGTPNLGAYGASKHAVIGLMRAAAAEGAADNIRVNTVNPGPINTRMFAAINAGRSPADPDVARQAGIARIPMQRYGRVEEIAALMLFLASDESSFVTGATHLVDGGSTA